MGSEGSSSVIIHVTGFKKFHGVSENPTETIVGNLKEYTMKTGLPKEVHLGDCIVLECAGIGALVPLHQTLQSAVNKSLTESSTSETIIWLHFGLNNSSTKFVVESQAMNEATFRCPDEMGWKPQKVPIIPSDGGISRIRETSIPVKKITKELVKMGYEVVDSEDAGRFVCNFVYYHSLVFAEQNGIKSIFVHVPPFSAIDEQTQMQFALSVLQVLASFA